jgi:general secretion pathway protein D
MRLGALGLALIMMTGCATGRAVGKAQSAAKTGDWDTAVAYYRQALTEDPSRLDVKIALQRAMGMAASEHIKRARELETQDQIPGAIAEYRLAADVDPTNTLSAVRANELERQLRERVEASRPPSTLSRLQAEVRQSSTIPTLDPRIRVPSLRFVNSAVRDILTAIAAFSNPPINVTYVQGTEALTGRPYSIDVQDLSLEEALNQVLSNNGLAYKVQTSKTILVFQDQATEHMKYDDLYTQVFFLSNIEPADMIQILNQMITPPGPLVRPQFSPSKSTSAITVKATAQVLSVIAKIIKANDKPKAEVMIDVEVLEVDRGRVKQLGLDLSQYALGFTFSPEVAPPNTVGTFPPTTPPPFNLNTISQGVSAQDFYLTVPTAVVRLLESDSKTRLLAKPSVRGAEGTNIIVNLGDKIPVLNSTIPSFTSAVGTTAPVNNFTYTPIGVNLNITPRVTFDDEIILTLTVENSGVGSPVLVGGQLIQSFNDRIVTTQLRLRDGESNLLAGLLREQSTTKNTGFAGLVRIPVLRNIFGNVDQEIDQSDIVIVVTPHIVRSHELTAEDLKPMYIGTGQSFGQTGAPALIGAEVPIPSGVTPPGGAAAPGGVPPAVAPAAPGAPPRAPGVVPIVPVAPEAPPVAAPAPAPPSVMQITVTSAPEFRAGASTPNTVPISVANATDLGTVTLRITYNTQALRAQSVAQGTFMNQGGIAPTFVPRIDANAGVVEIAISRPNTAGGASGASGLLASIQFLAMSPGSSQISVSGVAVTSGGAAIPVQFNAATVIVR